MTLSEEKAKLLVADVYTGVKSRENHEEFVEYLDEREILQWKLFDLSAYYDD